MERAGRGSRGGANEVTVIASQAERLGWEPTYHEVSKTEPEGFRPADLRLPILRRHPPFQLPDQIHSVAARLRRWTTGSRPRSTPTGDDLSESFRNSSQDCSGGN